MEYHKPALQCFCLKETHTIFAYISLAKVSHMATANFKGVGGKEMEMLEIIGSIYHGLRAASETAGEGLGTSPEHTHAGRKW